MNEYDKLIRLIKKRMPNSLTETVNIEDETLLMEDLGYDSLSFIQLLVDIEDAFNIEIDEIDFDKHNTFINLLEYIKKCTK